MDLLHQASCSPIRSISPDHPCTFHEVGMTECLAIRIRGSTRTFSFSHFSFTWFFLFFHSFPLLHRAWSVLKLTFLEGILGGLITKNWLPFSVLILIVTLGNQALFIKEAWLLVMAQQAAASCFPSPCLALSQSSFCLAFA